MLIGLSDRLQRSLQKAGMTEVSYDHCKLLRYLPGH